MYACEWLNVEMWWWQGWDVLARTGRLGGSVWTERWHEIAWVAAWMQGKIQGVIINLLLLLLYWYCIYAFLASCCKGACGYVQCWKSSVLSSFLNTGKVISGSFILGGRQFQAVGPAWKIPQGQLSWWRWLAQTGHWTPQISGVSDQRAKRPVCSIETDTGVRYCVDTCKRRYRVWTRPFLEREKIQKRKGEKFPKTLHNLLWLPFCNASSEKPPSRSSFGWRNQFLAY